VCGVLWLAGHAVQAQVLPVQPASPPTAPADDAAGQAAGTSGDIDGLIQALEDPDARAALLEKLRALRAADDTAPPPRRDATQADLVAATIIDDFASEFQRRTDGFVEIIDEIVESTDQLPMLVDWLTQQVTDPEQRTLWIGVLSGIMLIIAVGLAARVIVLRLRPRLDSDRPKQSCTLRFLVELVAAFVFGALTLGVLWLANAVAARYLVDLTLVANASLTLAAALFVAMLWRAVVRLLLGEPRCSVRLLPVDDEPARLAHDGLIRAGRLGFIGSGVLVALHELGLPTSLFQFLLHILFLVVAGIGIVLVLRLREPVAAAIRKWNDESDAALVRFVPGYLLARTWHQIVIVLILLHYLVWALKVPGGIVFLSRATVMTLAILVLARLATLGLDKIFASGVPLAVEGQDLPPGVQERASRYAAPMRILLRALVIGAAIVAVATAWNTGVLEWLRSDTGMAVVGLAARLGLIVGITILAIEIVSILAGRVVNAKDDQNKPLHSNRVRTLATIFANIFYFIFGLAGLFLALSNLGVETAPLLAGAGVVGLAIGFGSQALVKDLITGLFILLGDTIRVGDVIDIAGKSGVVEGMSMRTISLRSYDGNVHTIPYGSIDVVTNMTKEFSFALLDVEIAYKENTDDVIRVIREIDDRLRKEWPYRRLILEPIDVAGVEQFENSAVRLRMRSKTRPGEQWGIRREFLRRIKLRFDELGIEIPFPHQTVYFGTGKDGTSPPLRIERMGRELREVPPESDMAADGQEALSAPSQQGPRPATVQGAPIAANQGRRGGD
jgi:moderate conductance mechanosensitive channel